MEVVILRFFGTSVVNYIQLKLELCFMRCDEGKMITEPSFCRISEWFCDLHGNTLSDQTFRFWVAIRDLRMSDLVTLVTALVVLMTLLLLCFLTIGVGFGVWFLKNVGTFTYVRISVVQQVLPKFLVNPCCAAPGYIRARHFSYISVIIFNGKA